MLPEISFIKYFFFCFKVNISKDLQSQINVVFKNYILQVKKKQEQM